MDKNKIRKWAKIIAAWSLFWATAQSIFYILTLLSLINENLSNYDHIDFLVSIISGLVISFGLWHSKSWGWKFTIICIPLSWIYEISYACINYEKGMGIIISVFLLVDVAILHFLFKTDVMNQFGVSLKPWARFCRLTVLFLYTAIFLFIHDIWGAIVATVTIFSLSLGKRVAKKYKGKLQSTPSNCIPI